MRNILILFFIYLALIVKLYGLDLAQQPLTVSGSNNSNLMFLLDDSGSMDWEIMAAKHWTECAYDYENYPYSSTDYWRSCSNYKADQITSGRMYIDRDGSSYMSYIFDNIENIYGSCSGSSNSYGFGCASLTGSKEWRQRSADLNFMYYNPSLNYIPWKGECSSGSDCTNALFTSVHGNPKSSETGYSSTRNLSGESYDVWFDTKGFSGSYPTLGLYTNGANNYVDLWDKHYNIKFDNASQITVKNYTYTPTNSDIGESSNILVTLTDINSCYNILGPKSLVEQVESGALAITSVDAEDCRTIIQAEQNFANWYQYHRKRSYVAKAAISELINDADNIKFGLSLINDSNILVPVTLQSGESDTDDHNKSLLETLYTHNWQAVGTPLRIGLKTVGSYFDNNTSSDNPIQNYCQQNFAVVISDGAWNGSAPSLNSGTNSLTSESYGANSDGDSYSYTLADVASYYYKKDLSPLDDNVPINDFDTAVYQHLVTFMAAFGLEGTLVDTSLNGWPNPTLNTNNNWGGDPATATEYKADDMWHAAYNAKGTYSSAASPQELQENLGDALNNIQARVGSAASVAQSSTFLEQGASVYQTEYSSLGWTGTLKSYALDLISNDVGDLIWDAACYYRGACSMSVKPTKIKISDRLVISSNDQTGIVFKWSNLSANQKSSLLINIPDSGYSDSSYGNKIVNFLRGSAGHEVGGNKNTNLFKDRLGVMGDFVHSTPIYVSNPYRAYPDTLTGSPNYSTFLSTYATRDAIIYAGGNDGMLHGFNAETGAEVLAYIPGSIQLFSNLYRLAETNYIHHYFIDGSPTEADAYFNGSWHTVLSGGLGAGGQAVYLLDITDPSIFTTENAANIFLWEFDDSDDINLGYTFSQPQIARMANGKWALIFGNGYNSLATDDNVDSSSTTQGKSYLYIVFLDGIDALNTDTTWVEGSDYIKIPVGNAYPSDEAGLSIPTPIDIDGDFTVDYIYAGDIKGKMWRFDVTSSSTTDWSGSLVFDAGASKPITTAPVVKVHPNGIDIGYLILFGTGKFLEITDNTPLSQANQGIYAIWDKRNEITGVFDSVPSISELQEQTIIDEQVNPFTNGLNVRVTSDNSVNWNSQRGWYLTLQSSGSNNGERIINSPILRNGQMIFTSMIPESSNICDGMGNGWLMAFDAATGSRSQYTLFDLNNDDKFNDSDKVTIISGEEQVVVATGVQFSKGIIYAPAILNSQDGTFDLNVISGSGADSGSAGLETIKTNTANAPIGRVSWRILR